MTETVIAFWYSWFMQKL